jgi:hypothetical protein
MRRRHKLEVSTFPFLAVLLCAMGSLILLLLVMDRRAKIAARAKAHAIQLAALDRIDHEAKRRTEEAERIWETQKKKLHEMLRKEDDAIRLRKEQLDIAFAQTERDIQAGKTKLVDLERRLADEQRRLLQDRDDLVRFRQQVSDSMKSKSETNSLEAIRLARELEQLERLWQEMKQVRSQPRDVFSLVPFKGKRGEKRPPVYVECVRGGLAVHPQKTIVPVGESFDVAKFRREVESRSTALVKEKKNASALDKPHVLFLVRPEGIDSYHAAQSALAGFQIDFGYELVDAHWVFDFDPNAQPTSVAWNEPPRLNIEPSIVTPGSRKGVGVSLSAPRPQGAPSGDDFGPPGLGPPGLGSPEGNTAVQGTGSSGSPKIGPPPRIGPPGIGVAGGPGPISAPGGVLPGIGFSPGVPSFGKPGLGGPSAGAGSIGSSTEVGGSPIPGPSKEGPVGLPQGESTGGTGLAMRSSVPPLIPQLGPPSNPPSSGGSAVPKGAGASMGVPRGNAEGKPRPGGETIDGAPGEPGSPSGTAKGGAGARAPGGEPGIATSIKIPGQLPNPGAANGQSGEPANPVPPGTPGAVAGGGEGQSGEPPGEADPLALKFPPNMPRPKDTPQVVRKPPPPLGRLIANRDYQIVVKCLADRVEVTPGGLDFDMSDRNEADVDRDLTTSVRKLSERRQAAVRPGETPYRVNVRFQVHPEGLRTYLRVYPLMESLNLPMSRENLER